MRLVNAAFLLISSTKPPSRVYSSNFRRPFLSHFRFSSSSSSTSSSVAVMPGSISLKGKDTSSGHQAPLFLIMILLLFSSLTLEWTSISQYFWEQATQILSSAS